MKITYSEILMKRIEENRCVYCGVSDYKVKKKIDVDEKEIHVCFKCLKDLNINVGRRLKSLTDEELEK